MRIQEYANNSRVILAICLIGVWFVTSSLEDKAVEDAWQSYINTSYEHEPNEFKLQYKKLLNTYQQRSSQQFKFHGPYSYKNKYMQLNVDFEEDGKITIEKNSYNAGKNKVRASYKIVGSTMVFFDVYPSSSTWLRPGYYKETVNALFTEVQPFEIVNDNEIDWIGVNGRWKMIKKQPENNVDKL
jgi:hypothetical protein